MGSPVILSLTHNTALIDPPVLKKDQSVSSGLLLPTLSSLLVNRGLPFVHRDLSWVQFNERVLAEARNPQNPPLERLKFLGITSSNLDEFFMIRFASIGRSLSRSKKNDPQTRRRLLRIRANLLESVGRFIGHQVETFEILSSELSKSGVEIFLKSQEGDEGYELGKQIFNNQILPRLNPPEPFSISQLQSLENLQIAVIFGQNLFFRIPKSLPSSFVTNDVANKKTTIHFLDDLLATHLGSAFRIQGLPGLVRITRDGDFGVDLEEEDPETIPEFVRSKIGSREKGRPVRLQWMGDLSDQLLQRALHYLRISSQEVFPVHLTMGLQSLPGLLNQIEGLHADLRFKPFQSFVPAELRTPKSIFENLSRKDILLHHPYDSFDGFVNWIKAAAADPDVIRIEQTVYRMDALSPIVEALKGVAKTKSVRVIIELRARFDELNNLAITEELRQAGVEVAFGFGKLKLHAKIALVTRREAEGTRLYTHLSTGNYNATTARSYTDLAIMTSNPEIGADARNFFDSVWEQKIPSNFKQLVSAPLRLHRKLLSLIEAEIQAAKAGRKARIVAKVNALVDETVTDSLYRASQAGVQVDLIVRGACSLVPGVKGLSDNIRVISIVDRFLEHSRIYYFMDSRAMYLSSADWMPRNFFSRLEIAFPVLDARLYQYLADVLIPLYLLDTVKASELTAQGIWKKRTRSSIRKSDLAPAILKASKEPVNAQRLFAQLASVNYMDTPLGS